MKITRVETIPIQVPVRPEVAIRARTGYHSASPFLLVRIHTDENIVGVGEVSCTPVWSGEDQFTASHFIEAYLAPAIIGHDPREVERLTARLDAAIAENLFTKAGLEMALWDICGKASNLPLYRLLGGPVRDSVPTKWSISGLEPARAAEIAVWAAQQGFRAMKVKVGIDPEQDIARVKAVREAIGPEIRLGVDANGGWPPRVAIQTIRRLREQNIFFAEQPVAPLDISWMRDVRRSVEVAVIADESVFRLQDAMALARAEAADVFSIYVGKGGIGPARKIAAVAEAAGLTCTIGSNLELGVAGAAMVHLGMSTPGVGAEEFPCDIIGPLYYQDDVVTEPLPIAPGAARPNERPGLGVELDMDKVRHYRVD